MARGDLEHDTDPMVFQRRWRIDLRQDFWYHAGVGAGPFPRAGRPIGKTAFSGIYQDDAGIIWVQSLNTGTSDFHESLEESTRIWNPSSPPIALTELIDTLNWMTWEWHWEGTPVRLETANEISEIITRSHAITTPNLRLSARPKLKYRLPMEYPIHADLYYPAGHPSWCAIGLTTNEEVGPYSFAYRSRRTWMPFPLEDVHNGAQGKPSYFAQTVQRDVAPFIVAFDHWDETGGAPLPRELAKLLNKPAPSKRH